MRKPIQAIVAASLLISPCFGAVIATDDFSSYTAGNQLNANNGGTGWTSAWSSIATTTVESGVVAGYGNGVQVTAANNNNLVRGFANQSDTFYVGMVIRTNLSFVLGTDFAQFYFSDVLTDSNVDALGGGIRNQASGAYFTRIGAVANSSNATLTHTNDQNVSLVFKLSKVASVNYNLVELFVNQATEGTATTSRTNASAENVINSFHLRTAVWSTGSQLYLDQVRIATTYAEAYSPASIPEPAVALLSAFGALMLLRRRR